MKDDILMLSFSLKRRRVLIHRSTIRALGMPQNIRFLLNTVKNRVVVQSCEPIDRDNFAVPDLDTVCQYEISSINFLNVVYKLAKWDTGKTYRVEGKLYVTNHLVEFDLTRSVQISDDEFVDEDAIIPDSIKTEFNKEFVWLLWIFYGLCLCSIFRMPVESIQPNNQENCIELQE